jgi:tetratricopeptide (TPR) repeat protein
MSEREQLPDMPLEALLEALPALSEDAMQAFIAASGYTPAGVVQALKERSFAALAAKPAHAQELATVGVRVAAACDEATRALAARGMAQSLHANSRYAEALVYYDAAHVGFAAAGESLEAARTLLGKVGALMYLGRYQEAMGIAHSARAALAELGDHRRAARMDVNLGNIYHRLDRPSEALTAYMRARAALESHGDALDLAHVDHNLGNVLAALNRFEEALSAYGAAIATYQANGEEAEGAWTAYNRAYLHFLRGNFGQALTELARARGTFSTLNDRRHLALCDLAGTRRQYLTIWACAMKRPRRSCSGASPRSTLPIWHPRPCSWPRQAGISLRRATHSGKRPFACCLPTWPSGRARRTEPSFTVTRLLPC